ncbi:MAG: hypothetical protein ACRD4T_00160 [Candidatus Acidiferrales bacterium]
MRHALLGVVWLLGCRAHVGKEMWTTTCTRPRPAFSGPRAVVLGIEGNPEVADELQRVLRSAGFHVSSPVPYLSATTPARYVVTVRGIQKGALCEHGEYDIAEAVVEVYDARVAERVLSARPSRADGYCASPARFFGSFISVLERDWEKTKAPVAGIQL